MAIPTTDPTPYSPYIIEKPPMKHLRELFALAILVCGCLPSLAAETVERAAPENPPLIKLPFCFSGMRMENTPVVYGSRHLLVQNQRSNKPGEEQDKCYLFIEDLTTGAEVARFGTGFSFVSALVNGNEMNVFATVNTSKEWTKDIYRFWSTDLKTWKQEIVIARDGDEHLFNCSVCRDDQGYIMAYESNKPVAWSFRFARSKDLAKWEKIRDIEFSDLAEKSYCACPAIRYFAPYYYVIYSIARNKGVGTRYLYQRPETMYAVTVARSKDLVDWEVSPTKYPMLDPVAGEGINNSDADLFEVAGRTYVCYATGDQATWGTIRVAMYDGPMKKMLGSYFPNGVPTVKFDARQRKYVYPPAH